VAAALGQKPGDLALIEADSGLQMTYGELQAQIAARAAEISALASDGGLALQKVELTAESVISLLALREAGIPVVLCDPAIDDDELKSLQQRYIIDLVVHNETVTSTGQHVEARTWGEPVEVLLRTSGSTGNPKLVQLTGASLNTNAVDIVEALGITSGDRGLAPLPLHYSYGLSILNSHLAAGACTVLTTASPIRPEFWEAIEEYSVSSLPGVPYSYEMYRRAGIEKRLAPSVRYLSQAGGKLKRPLVDYMRKLLADRNCDFFIMYGQTEAGPRMSVLPSSELEAHPDSAGYAMASGRFDIHEPDAEGVGEVVYTGPNVMIGYAGSDADLGVRTLDGSLSTGDLGRLDAEGRLYITGRIKRIAKLFGIRVNLDDIEAHFSGLGSIAAVERTNYLEVLVERTLDAELAASLVSELEQRLGVPPRSVRVSTIEELPLNANGKIDYRSLST